MTCTAVSFCVEWATHVPVLGGEWLRGRSGADGREQAVDAGVLPVVRYLHAVRVALGDEVDDLITVQRTTLADDPVGHRVGRLISLGQRVVDELAAVGEVQVGLGVSSVTQGFS